MKAKANMSIARAASLALAAALLAAGPIGAQTTFKKYVALGDSLTAGVEGNCLVSRNQLASFPHVLAGQLAIADFQTQTVPEKSLSNPLTGNPCLGAVVAGGTITVGAVSQMGGPPFPNGALARPYDNLGLSGANTSNLVNLKTSNPSGNTANQSAALVLRNFPTGPFEGKSAVDEALLLAPDLVTVWIGNNDVLGAALAGVALDGVTLTSVASFTTNYTAILTALKATGRTVVTLNIPDVTAIAFTTTIPPILVNPATRQPVIVNGSTVPLLGSRALPPGCPTAPCPIPPTTLVTLQASALLAQGFGIPVALGGNGQGLPDGGFTPPATLNPGVLLYADEVTAIQTRTGELNAQIASIGTANGAIPVDIHAFFDNVKVNGYEIGGLTITKAFLTGGIFSADGFHPTNIAYTVVADEIIKVLNAKGAAIPEPDFSKVLFTPNVPTPSGIIETGAGIWGFSLNMAQALQAYFPPVDEDVNVIPITARPPVIPISKDPKKGAPRQTVRIGRLGG
jgi:lysophospholipase L1-like esterase